MFLVVDSVQYFFVGVKLVVINTDDGFNNFTVHS